MTDTETRLTGRERTLERLYGMTMPSLLVDAYNRHGSQKGAAEELNVSEKTFGAWLEKWGVAISPPVAVAPSGEPELVR